MTEPLAHWMPVLHAHLPFVRHPQWDDPIEERWLHEAVVECYLPLLEVIRGWRRDGVDFKLGISLSPPLVAMLDDELLRGRTRRYLESRVELAEKEVFRTHGKGAVAAEQAVTRFYRERLGRLLNLYNVVGGDLAGAFGTEARAGGLDLLTCTATHGFLPLLQPQPELVRLQVRLGAEAFRRRFGWDAPGLWNAECGFFRGLDVEFAGAGLGFFFVETHALEGASVRPRCGVGEALRCEAGPVAFGRDPVTSREVWDATHGYPGDPEYREFHRDIGYDLELEYVLPYIHESGLRLATGLKYHAVTGGVGLGEKKLYDPARAAERVREHARDFAAKREAQARAWREGRTGERRCGHAPVICSPFDAELFGHWWFEGPAWLDATMRELCRAESPVRPVRPTEYLEAYGGNLRTGEPAFSSWGEGGYGAVWLAEGNRWIYPILHKAGEGFLEVLGKHKAEGNEDAGGVERRALNQCARELLLAQSSDWAFLITMGTAPEYAGQRTRDHIAACEKLAEGLRVGGVDQAFLAEREGQYNFFVWLDVLDLMDAKRLPTILKQL